MCWVLLVLEKTFCFGHFCQELTQHGNAFGCMKVLHFCGIAVFCTMEPNADTDYFVGGDRVCNHLEVSKCHLEG